VRSIGEGEHGGHGLGGARDINDSQPKKCQPFDRRTLHYYCARLAATGLSGRAYDAPRRA